MSLTGEEQATSRARLAKRQRFFFICILMLFSQEVLWICVYKLFQIQTNAWFVSLQKIQKK